MASCSDDIDVNVGTPGQEVEVTFSTALPSQMLSRAISDGTTADRLNYTVFKDGSAIYSNTITSAFSTTTRTQEVSIPLITGETYTIAFWADNSGSAYTYANGQVTINYTNAKANDETADAFFWTEKDLKITGPTSKTVYLTRPFAQINFGTTKEDYEAAQLSGLDISTTQVKVEGTSYTGLNLLTGEVSNPTDVTYALNTQPSDPATLTVEGTDYVYVAYAYVLTPPVDKAENITKVTLTPKATDAAVREYTTIPVKRNYRTNIIGNLFTSTVDFKVIIDQNYIDDINENVVNFKNVLYPYDLTPWDGTTTTAPYTNSDGDIIITSAAQLAGLAAQTTGALSRTDGSTFEGEDIYLLVDVDLDNQEWTPIGADSSYPFQGYFHGGGKTISNLKVTKATEVAGLFGWSHGASIEALTIENAEIDATNIATSTVSNSTHTNGKATGSAAVVLAAEAGSDACSYDGINNVNVINATIKSHHYAGGIVGCFQHFGAKTAIQNCNVQGLEITLEFEKLTSGEYDNADKAGGIVGQSGAIGKTYYLNIQNNVVRDLKITGYRDLACIIGGTNSQVNVLNNSVDYAVIKVDNTQDYGPTKAKNVSEICGAVKDNMTVVGNTYNEVYIFGLDETLTEVANATDLSTAMTSGGYVELTADIPSTTGAIVAGTSTVLFGNDNTITTTANRGIQLSQYAGEEGSLTIYDLNLDMSEASIASNNNIRGIQLNGDGDLENPILNLTNVTVKTTPTDQPAGSVNYGINVRENLGTVNINLEDTQIDAYQCINLYTQGTLTIKNSVLNSYSTEKNYSGACITMFGEGTQGDMEINLVNVDFNTVQWEGYSPCAVIGAATGYSKTITIKAVNCTIYGKDFNEVFLEYFNPDSDAKCTVILNGETIYQEQ